MVMPKYKGKRHWNCQNCVFKYNDIKEYPCNKCYSSSEGGSMHIDLKEDKGDSKN